jgi:8-oxo-dGTP diphosphatase
VSGTGGRVIEVAAAVVERPDGCFLLAQRPAGKVYAGWWEFPGGKVEAGESVQQALARELHEELGLVVERSWPWITREHRYEHGHVRLHFHRVDRWRGEPRGREGQRFSWQARADRPTVAPLLPANGPVLSALSVPVTMGVSDASGMGETAFLAALDRALAQGLRMVQFREKTMPAMAARSLLGKVQARVDAVGGRVVVNADGTAIAQGAQAIHLPDWLLASIAGRPGAELVGGSCHDAAGLSHARRLALDYVLLGPVLATPSHPGAPAMGWSRFAALVAGMPMPVFAIGGLSPMDLDEARAAGAHGVAGIRGFWSGR